MSLKSALLKLRKEIYLHKLTYLLLGIVLGSAFFLRVYRVNDLLGFYFDQGRDALVVWDLIKHGRLFLIGPTTGLAGIFRGPYYYYLIAPAYFLGNGNPIFASVFLSLTTVAASILGFYLGVKIQNRATGIIFAILTSFSFYILMASRWLSNPTPMLLLSMILVWTMFKVIEGKNWAWPVMSLTAGLSLFNFGSSGELYYFVSIGIFLIWQWENRPTIKNLILSAILFCLTFAPLVLFDFKHEHILLNNITQTFGKEKSFTLPYLSLFELRNQLYVDFFPKLIFYSIRLRENVFLITIVLSFVWFLPKLLKNSRAKVLMLLLISPILGLYFYQGNGTVLYEYYLTGYYLIILLLVSVVLGKLWELNLGKSIVLMFLLLFLVNNYEPTHTTLKNKSDTSESISFINQKQALDWIYKDANGKKFNVDIYVPPVIPYAYDYLFTWLGTTVYGKLPESDRVELLYTLHESDSSHPERINPWLSRQDSIGKIEQTYKSGGITVERRIRI